MLQTEPLIREFCINKIFAYTWYVPTIVIFLYSRHVDKRFLNTNAGCTCLDEVLMRILPFCKFLL